MNRQPDTGHTGRGSRRARELFSADAPRRSAPAPHEQGTPMQDRREETRRDRHRRLDPATTGNPVQARRAGYRGRDAEQRRRGRRRSAIASGIDGRRQDSRAGDGGQQRVRNRSCRGIPHRPPRWRTPSRAAERRASRIRAPSPAPKPANRVSPGRSRGESGPAQPDPARHAVGVKASTRTATSGRARSAGRRTSAAKA